jgi:serine/threonine-protein kinase
MARYWGLHQIAIYGGDLNRFNEGIERWFRENPYDAGVSVDDFVFLFWGPDYLYGWGRVTALGDPYVNTSGQRVIDARVDPRVLSQSPVAKLQEIEQRPAFGNAPWERKNGALASFNPEQAETLISLLPADRPRPPSPPREIPNGWERIERRALGGNQAKVIKVHRRRDAQLGALKRLHDENQKNTERRARVYREVIALKALEGKRTPLLLESNAQLWADKQVDLYVIMEWIEGPTLLEQVTQNPLTLDRALVTTKSLLRTLETTHELEMFHRDLKPDNVILRDGDITSPIVVDFGMAFTRSSEDGVADLETAEGQELGNRFLRLPEYGPNQHSFRSSIRSDPRGRIAFYMITGRSPRQLQDAQGRMPHQAFVDSVSEEIRSDPRWPRLEGLFNVGFQHRIDLRFQSARQLGESLERLSTQNEEEAESRMAHEVEQLEALRSSDEVRFPKLAMRNIREVGQKLFDELRSKARKAGFNFSGDPPAMIEEEGRPGSNMLFGIYIANEPKIGARGSHTIRYRNKQYVAAYGTERTAPVEYYHGSVLDVAALEHAITMIVPRILAELIALCRDRLKQSVAQG